MGTQHKSIKKSWKEKAVERARSNNRLRQELKRQKLRAAKWRSDYYALKESSQPKAVSRHSYPLELMWLGVLMHIHFNVSLRGVSNSLKKLGELYGLSITSLSSSTIRNWCLKLGFYCLSQKIDSGKYVLICDESVEIGREHLMLLLLVPIENSSPFCALCMEDVKVLDLSVQQSWKAVEVAEMIKEKVDKYAIELVYGISDKGHLLRAAMKDCGICWIGDCTHEMANITQSLFKKDDLLNSFVKQMNALRAKWIMSKNNLYVPPGLRAKSRFHQLLVIHKWAAGILNEWDSIPCEAKEKLDFVAKNKALIKTMRECDNLIEIFAKIFKAKGIHSQSLKEWDEAVENYKNGSELSDKAKLFVQKMNDYLSRQQEVFPTDNQILCCSDIIESMFGKYKNKGGAKIITEDVLNIAAYTKQQELEEVEKAMLSVKIRDINEWKKNNVPTSKLALLKQKQAA